MIGICIKCQKEKEYFRKNICRYCYQKKYVKRWKEKNKEHIKKYLKKWFSEHSKYMLIWQRKNKEHLKQIQNIRSRSECQRKYREKYPEKIKAQQIAQRTPLKSNCEECSSIENLERHHPDYSKPTFCRTLCRRCHIRIHNRGD